MHTNPSSIPSLFFAFLTSCHFGSRRQFIQAQIWKLLFRIAWDTKPRYCQLTCLLYILPCFFLKTWCICIHVMSSGSRLHGWGEYRSCSWFACRISGNFYRQLFCCLLFWLYEIKLNVFVWRKFFKSFFQDLLQFVLEHVEDKNVLPLLEVLRLLHTSLFWSLVQSFFFPLS